jgi:hypothetical protein
VAKSENVSLGPSVAMWGIRYRIIKKEEKKESTKKVSYLLLTFLFIQN